MYDLIVIVLVINIIQHYSYQSRVTVLGRSSVTFTHSLPACSAVLLCLFHFLAVSHTWIQQACGSEAW